MVYYVNRTAGNMMISGFPSARKGELVSKVSSSIQKRASELKTISYVYVIDDDDKLLGIVPIKKLFSSPKNTRIEKIMRINFVSVSPDTMDEKVAHLAIKNNIKAVPVTKKGVLLGVVPTDKILTILNNSLLYDIMHFAGIHKSHFDYENTFEVPFKTSVMSRLPWLLIGLLGIALAAGFISLFENMLEEHIIIAFFIPAIVYMSGATGAQHQTLLIRDLTILGKDLDIKKYFIKSMLVGFSLGLIIAVAVYFIISIIWQEPFIALIIATSMLITLVVSSFTSIIITYSIRRLRLDPALGSGPLATIISDVTSIILYFVVVSLMLGI